MGGLNIVDNEVTTATISPTTLLGYWDNVCHRRKNHRYLKSVFRFSNQVYSLKGPYHLNEIFDILKISPFGTLFT